MTQRHNLLHNAIVIGDTVSAQEAVIRRITPASHFTFGLEESGVLELEKKGGMGG